MEDFISLLQRRVWLGPLLAIILLVAGFGLGLALGWATVDFKSSADDLAAAADSFALNNNRDLAKQRLSSLSKGEQERIISDLIRDASARGKTADAQRLGQLAQAMGLSVSATGAAPAGTPVRPPAGPPAAQTNPFANIGLLFVALVAGGAIVLAAAWVLISKILPQLRSQATPVKAAAPPPRRPAPPPVAAPPQVAPARAAPPQTAPPAPVAVRATAPVPAPVHAPAPQGQTGLGRFTASYLLGNDNYDTSFSLETARQEFLGECGMGISETIGEGKPDKVTAFDLWLFDKADVRTVTQILMSEHAFNDQNLRAKLMAKGELVLAEKGKVVELETQSLRLKAKVVEVIYANNASFPANSHFQKLVVEILPSLKEVIAA